MENHSDNLSRLDWGLAQAYEDLNECLAAQHNLAESLRYLRMQLEVWKHLTHEARVGTVQKGG